MKRGDVPKIKSNITTKINEKWPKHGAARNVNCFYDPWDRLKKRVILLPIPAFYFKSIGRDLQ
jgi:hypothetical protein